MKLSRIFQGILLFTGLTVLALLSLSYLQTIIFDFPDETPFSGNYFHNPYRNIETRTWYKANFHGHAVAWGGVTNGSQDGPDVIDTYRKMGYDIPLISNYHQIDPAVFDHAPLPIPVYEHGYNLMKSHRLAIGSEYIDFTDFPLGHFASHQQLLIDKLKDHSPVVALAHPRFNQGHHPERMKVLTGYDCVEVLNHYRNSEDHWDAALSAGRPVWIIGNDDTHDVEDPSETGVNWTMVASGAYSLDSVLTALRTGSAYGVTGKNGTMDNRLVAVKLNGEVLSIQFELPAKRIEFIGQKGKILQTVENTALASYTIQSEDTYVRTRIINAETTFLLNPVIRTETAAVPENIPLATINYPLTIFFRALVLFVNGAVFVLLFGRFFRLRAQRKPSIPEPAPVRLTLNQ